MSLKHESELVHLGQTRKVALEIRARAVGEITGRLGRAELGSQHGFVGYLGPQRNGRGVVFHIVEATPEIPAGPAEPTGPGDRH